MTDKLAFMADWFQRVWIDGDLDAIGGFFAPRSVARGLMTGLDMQPDEFREIIPAIMSLISTPVIRVVRHCETDDWLWALVTVEAKAARSLAPVQFSGQIMTRFSDGKIAEAFNQFDMIALFEQIGAMPAETVALCLSGEQLG